MRHVIWICMILCRFHVKNVSGLKKLKTDNEIRNHAGRTLQKMTMSDYLGGMADGKRSKTESLATEEDGRSQRKCVTERQPLPVGCQFK